MAPIIYRSSFTPMTEAPNISISQFMTDYNPDNVPGDKIVHVDTISGKQLTYSGLRKEAGKCAWGLQHKLGFKQQQKIMAVLPNCTDFVLLAHATWWAGGVFTPLNYSSAAKEIAHAIALVEPDLIFVDPSRIEAVKSGLEKARSGLSTTPKIITVLRAVEGYSLFPEDVTGKDDRETIPPYDLEGRSAKDTVAAICFSSGTTGNIKGVQLTHFNLISSVLQGRVSLPGLANSTQREVFFAPYCHIYGLSVVVLQIMWVGGFACAIPAFDLELFCSKMFEHRATCAHIVPPVAVLLANSDTTLKYDLSSLRTMVIAAAPLKEALQKRLKSRFGNSTSVIQGYGMTECSPGITHMHEADDHHVGSIGKLFAGTEVRLVDPNTENDVTPGDEGELWVRGPQVMLGYIKNEKATSETIRDGWLRTGDILRVDENNNFWVTDRLKELIKYKGFQVAPSELEDLLLHHPHVIDAAVCSIYDDEQATEIPIAYVSLKLDLANLPESGKQAILAEIQTWADNQVAGYKKLRGGVFHLQQLPKTPSGKILRRELPAKLKQKRTSKI
ncbi:putative amp dependent CoA ligase [Delphinella strobiligena]|nr:putative amp dependent CoA ligase [Delphinella strobiligena]